jgi:uncharacterized protein (DUF2267 family)
MQRNGIVDQIIQAVAQKANISPEAAKTAVETVLNLLKSKLPSQFASQIDAAMSGATPGGDLAKDAESLLGGAFGKK